jgi:3-isopropylmalate/(R)-2-methylmalate dehydratase small subunit
MAYDKFNILRSSAVPLSIENVDTDQIIPARFLKATERVGFGDNLFRDWRYNSDNSPKAEFVLNNPLYSGKILVGGKTLVPVHPGSMLHGQFMITDSDV